MVLKCFKQVEVRAAGFLSRAVCRPCNFVACDRLHVFAEERVQLSSFGLRRAAFLLLCMYGLLAALLPTAVKPEE